MEESHSKIIHKFHVNGQPEDTVQEHKIITGKGIDYLISITPLKKETSERVRNNLDMVVMDICTVPVNVCEEINIPEGKVKHKVAVKAIFNCIAAGDYTEIHFTNRPRLVIRCPISRVYSLLPKEEFFQIDRGEIVKRILIDSIDTGKAGNVIYKDKSPHKISKYRKEGLLEWYNKG